MMPYTPLHFGPYGTLALARRVLRRHGLRHGGHRIALAMAAWSEHGAFHHADSDGECYAPDCEALDRAYDWLDA